MKCENQERRKRELWRLKGRIERKKNEKGALFFFFCSYPYGSGITKTLANFDWKIILNV